MREIKFRAWDSIGKQWLWITGIETTETRKSDGYTFGGLFHDGDYVGNKGIKLMQFTGLHDKNDIEVYEDDVIVDEIGYLAVVKFGEHLTSTDYYASDAYGWYAERAVNGDTHSLAQCGTITVRGNIHEHPHLLEQANE